MSMLGNSYTSGGGPLSQSHVQAVNNLNSMAMLNDVNSNENSTFGVDDFPLLNNRPNSAGGAHGQIGNVRTLFFSSPESYHLALARFLGLICINEWQVQ